MIYGISTLVGYLMPDSALYIYIYIYIHSYLIKQYRHPFELPHQFYDIQWEFVVNKPIPGAATQKDKYQNV